MVQVGQTIDGWLDGCKIDFTNCLEQTKNSIETKQKFDRHIKER
jgi:hypothetical protein